MRAVAAVARDCPAASPSAVGALRGLLDDVALRIEEVTHGAPLTLRAWRGGGVLPLLVEAIRQAIAALGTGDVCRRGRYGAFAAEAIFADAGSAALCSSLAL
jgi:hypothetical protein